MNNLSGVYRCGRF